ncbi:MAG: type I phosphomannose isomerase catalytic subunit [Verrucomicrobiota bacterium]
MFDSLLTFAPLYQTRVWGGRRLETLLGRQLPEAATPYGESWEVSDREQEQSAITLPDGGSMSLNELWLQHRETVFGVALAGHPAQRYPLLMKILDACDDLSIQVHPPASVAPELGGEPKTEMWYVLHAEPGAKIYAGLREGMTREVFDESIRSGTVAEAVQVLEPRAGDCLFIPSGLIHAIGAGLVIYEVQQNSDTTYRVFDWNRVGLDGKPRQMHVQESLRSIDFAEPPPAFQKVDVQGRLVACEFFEIRQGSASSSAHLGAPGEHLVLAMISGEITAAGKTLHAGDFAMVPACLDESAREFTPSTGDARWLEIRIPAP